MGERTCGTCYSDQRTHRGSRRPCCRGSHYSGMEKRGPFAMGIPLFWCPDELGPVWWIPVMCAGYPVYLPSEACVTRILGSRLNRSRTAGASLQTNCFGLVLAPSWPESPPLSNPPPLADFDVVAERACGLSVPCAHVSSTLDLDGIWGWEGSSWVMLGGDRTLTPALLRILLGSGCLCCGEMMGCKKYYLTSQEIALHWPTLLHLPGIEIDVGEWGTIFGSDSPAAGRYQNGEIKRGPVSIEMFSGQGFDVRSNQDTYYMAIDYHQRFFGSRSMDNLVAEVDLELARLACICVDKVHILRR